MLDIEPGVIGRYETTVGPEHTAASMGNRGMEVLATPYVVMMMEGAAYTAVVDQLEEGEGVVGTRIDIRHLAPTAIGRPVMAECRLEEVNGRRLVFSCVARSGETTIADARYESMVVDLQRILDRAAQL